MEKIWRPTSLSELTPIIFNMELTHLCSEVSKYQQNTTSSLDKWRPLSLSELTPLVFNTGLTHLGLDVSIFNNGSPPNPSELTLC